MTSAVAWRSSASWHNAGSGMAFEHLGLDLDTGQLGVQRGQGLLDELLAVRVRPGPLVDQLVFAHGGSRVAEPS